MALSHKARKRWSLVLLLVWLPLYVIIAVTLLAMIGDLNKYIAIPIYAILGVAWAFPFKAVFQGVGSADPDANDADS